MTSPPWYLALDAADWIGTPRFQGIPGAEANGRAVRADLEEIVAGHPWGRDFEYDPEADTIAVFSHRSEDLESLVAELRRTGMVSHAQLAIHATEQDPPAQDADAVPAPVRAAAPEPGPTDPGGLTGPYRWSETGGLRAYLYGSDARPDWRAMSGEALAVAVQEVLAGVGLDARLRVAVDGRNSISIDGSAMDDFRLAASALGLPEPAQAD